MNKGGMATGKRNKEGRKRRKEQERVEYLDHQKRRLENYIKAEVSFYPTSNGEGQKITKHKGSFFDPLKCESN